MVTKLTARPDYNRLYSQEEFEALELPQENGAFYELIGGQLVMVPPAGDDHGRIAQRLNRQIILFDPEGKLGMVWQATRFKIGPNFGPAPDLAFVTASHIPPAGPGAVEAIPDLVVEVCSPGDLDSQPQRELARMKIRQYQMAGVRLVWAINLRQRQVEVYRPDRIKLVAVLKETSELDGAEVLPGFRLAVKALLNKREESSGDTSDNPGRVAPAPLSDSPK